MQIINRLTIVIVAAAFVIACADGETKPTVSCNGTPVLFSEANSIMQSSCAQNSSCHGNGSRNGPGALLTYNQIYNVRIAIKSAVASGRMPQGGSLSADSKNAIICWIESGAPNN